MIETLAANIEEVKHRIAAACERAGRDPAEVTLLPVTKTHPPEVIVDLMELGFTAFGENRVQELRDKAAALGPGPEWHLIGNLQKNKVKYLPQIGVRLFHALDSIDLARAIDAVSEKRGPGKSLDVLLEVNASGEASKHGVSPDDAPLLLREIRTLAHLRPCGLMTMAPYEAAPEATRSVFRTLCELRARLQDELDTPLPILSMGMSNDFEVAIEEGATLVRLGSILFGPRVGA